MKPDDLEGEEDLAELRREIDVEVQENEEFGEAMEGGQAFAEARSEFRHRVNEL